MSPNFKKIHCKVLSFYSIYLTKFNIRRQYSPMRCSLPTAPGEGLNTGKWIVDCNKKEWRSKPSRRASFQEWITEQSQGTEELTNQKELLPLPGLGK